jgi:hypothetical protein
MPRLNQNDFVEAEVAQRRDIANDEQLEEIDAALRQSWLTAIRRGSVPDAVMSPAQFNQNFAQLLLILAGTGASEQLADHPDLNLRADIPAGGNTTRQILIQWRMIQLRPILKRVSGDLTVRRFARAYADDVYDYYKQHQPVPATAWHSASGIPPEHYAVAFDFADAINPDKLSTEERALVLGSRRYTIRARAGPRNLYDVAREGPQQQQ